MNQACKESSLNTKGCSKEELDAFRPIANKLLLQLLVPVKVLSQIQHRRIIDMTDRDFSFNRNWNTLTLKKVVYYIKGKENQYS